MFGSSSQISTISTVEIQFLSLFVNTGHNIPTIQLLLNPIKSTYVTVKEDWENLHTARQIQRKNSFQQRGIKESTYQHCPLTWKSSHRASPSQGSPESMSSTQSFHLSLYLSIFLPFSNFILAMIFENNSRMNNFRKRAAIESKLIAFMKFVVSYERTHILTHLEKEFETFESVQKALELIDEANLRRGSTKEIRRSYFEIFEWRSQWIL